MFGQRFADGRALCQQERVGNPAAYNQLVNLVSEAVQNGQLGGNLAARYNGYQRVRGGFQSFAQSVQLAGHQYARAGHRCRLSHSFGRGLGAVGGAECVVDEYITKGGVSFAQFKVVFLFAFVDAHVLQHGHFTGLQRGFVFTPVVQYFYVFAQQLAQMGGYRCHIVFRLEFAFGRAAEMRHHNHGGAVIQAVLNRSERGANAGVIADGAVFKRHIHVGADQHGFALHILLGEFQKGHIGFLVGE